jgi:lysophospholipase L1-like esterase
MPSGETIMTESRRSVVVRVLTFLAVLAALSISRSAHAQTRIMPLGDSITGSPGCWRALLWNDLQSAGFTSIDFVGTLPPQGCGVAYDGDNDGHGGFLATNIADQNLLPAWLAATRPDIVMMHLGTNDVWNARSPAVILTAFSKLVDQMRAQNPNMQVLVAQIIPMNPSNCPDCANRGPPRSPRSWSSISGPGTAPPRTPRMASTPTTPVIARSQTAGFRRCARS